jgi:beta-fructofuranosidase
MKNSIQTAMESVNKAKSIAESCPYRPGFHFLAPAYWMNDPNGTIFINGEYHLFYQHNPYKNKWGSIHWGHAKSKDLVHWEHLPIALAPSKDLGERYCYSGCCVNDNGIPKIIYTKIGSLRDVLHGAEQWMAIGDKNLINWNKYEKNPVMDDSLHGDLKVLQWRDPYMWKEEDTWYCIIGGHFRWKHRGVVFLYKSSNLKTWEYLGTLYQGKKGQGWNFECPNFFPLGEKHILIVSPHGKVIYGIGSYREFKFLPESWHILDYGKSYYATNTLFDDKGRTILFGWIKGGGKGWNGCISIPRVLSLDKNGDLKMEPIPELNLLRENEKIYEHIEIREGERKELINSSDGMIELKIIFDITRDKSFNMVIGKGNKEGLVECIGKATGQDEALRIFIDKSVIEVFINKDMCITEHFNPKTTSYPIYISSKKGDISIKSLMIWKMKSIWK